MLMADMGADAVRVDRPTNAQVVSRAPYMGRGRRSIALDLKHQQGQALCLQLVDWADVLVEGMRPGVMERLGLGPDICCSRNERLVYARMTGWGQEGPLAGDAGHDINYIAISGVLGTIGTTADPIVPLNLVADFGGGGMLLLCGVLMALHERARSGLGQVVDAAMVDGTSLLMTLIRELRAEGSWVPRRAANLLDGGAPFYTTYPTLDGGHVAVGALEPQFFVELLERLGLDYDPAAQHDRSQWDHLRELLSGAFASRTRAQVEHLLGGTDACVTPVLSIDEAPSHPHARSRGSFRGLGADALPGSAPRFSRTPGAMPPDGDSPGASSGEILEMLGVEMARGEALLAAGTVVQTSPRSDELAR
jgi:alpha-methylacyl-CoA racemase